MPGIIMATSILVNHFLMLEFIILLYYFCIRYEKN